MRRQSRSTCWPTPSVPCLVSSVEKFHLGMKIRENNSVQSTHCFAGPLTRVSDRQTPVHAHLCMAATYFPVKSQYHSSTILQSTHNTTVFASTQLPSPNAQHTCPVAFHLVRWRWVPALSVRHDSTRSVTFASEVCRVSRPKHYTQHTPCRKG